MKFDHWSRQAEVNQRNLQSESPPANQELAREIPTLAFAWMRVQEERAKQADEIREAWKDLVQANPSKPTKDLKDWSLENWSQQFRKPAIKLDDLPPLAILLQCRIRLRKPYISRDDHAFYILDNPIRRDKLLHLPVAAGSGLKGAFKAALREDGIAGDDLERLFGTAGEDGTDGEEAQMHAGSLHFFSTFFGEVSLEVINPHERQHKTGKNPILIECVPAGSEGWFTLLDLPADAASAAADLELIRRGLALLFEQGGFGAKTAAGFGMADVEDGELSCRVAPPPAPLETDESRQFTDDYGIKDFSLTPNEYRLKFKPPKDELDEYRQAYDSLHPPIEKWWQKQFNGLCGPGERTLELRISQLKQQLEGQALQ